MASLTPGVLSKLLNHAGDKTFKAVGDHRTPLLQVIEIVPALSPDDPWRTKGFYLKLSDSEHAAYASVAEEDLELIYGDKIQLGQFVHVSRLDFGKPVPVIRGIKPLPRRRPCVGSPKDLISSDLLQPRASRRKNGLSEASPSPRKSVLEESKCRRGSLGSGKRLVLEDNSKMKPNGRRLSLDSTRRGWDHQPCPTPRSVNAARLSVSRLKSTTTSETPVTLRRVSVVIAATYDKNLIPRIKPLAMSPVGSVKKPSRPVISLKTSNACGVLPLQSKEKALINDLTPSIDANVSGCLANVSLSSMSSKKILWDSLPKKIQELGKGVASHRDVAIFSATRALEEAVVMERIVGCMSMFADLCESSENCSAGSVVEIFLELHLSMEKTASVIDTMLGSNASTFNSISEVSPHLTSDASDASKNAKAWIQAALETDLSRFSLYSKQCKKGTVNDEKIYRVVLEKTTKEDPKFPSLCHARITSSQASHLSNGTGKVHGVGVAHPLLKHCSAPMKVLSDREQVSCKNGIKEAATLAQKLIWVSRQWFLKYLETSLKKGFGIQGDDKSLKFLFGNLKRVNQWLEELVGNKHEIDERVDAVRKKLYNFLLENVDSAVHVTK